MISPPPEKPSIAVRDGRTDSFVELGPDQATAPYMRLLRSCASRLVPTDGFTSLGAKLVSGRLRWLKAHYLQRTFFLMRGPRAVAVAIGFLPLDAWLPVTIGGFLFDDDLSEPEIHAFLDMILDRLPEGDVLFPLNGHINFGVSALFPGENPMQISFMSSAWMKGFDALFSYPRAQLDRTFLALTTAIDIRKVEVLKGQLAARPPGITTRKLSRLHFRRDVELHNRLVSASMSHLAYFQPLSSAEAWDLMRSSRPILLPALSRFLCHEGREIGYCFAFLDYNQILGHSPEPIKAAKVLFAGRKITRARIYSSGILPEYRGKKLFSFLRNEVLVACAGMGITELESSYVDTENAQSLGNVRSKGGEVSHRFGVLRVRR